MSEESRLKYDMVTCPLKALYNQNKMDNNPSSILIPVFFNTLKAKTDPDWLHITLFSEQHVIESYWLWDTFAKDNNIPYACIGESSRCLSPLDPKACGFQLIRPTIGIVTTLEVLQRYDIPKGNAEMSLTRVSGGEMKKVVK
jgi:hypothetical protein